MLLAKGNEQGIPPQRVFFYKTPLYSEFEKSSNNKSLYFNPNTCD